MKTLQWRLLGGSLFLTDSWIGSQTPLKCLSPLSARLRRQLPRPGVLVFLMQFCSPLQAHILLSWQRDDGRESRALQGSLLDLEQLLGGVQQGNRALTLVSFLLPFPARSPGGNNHLQRSFKLGDVTGLLQTSLLSTASDELPDLMVLVSPACQC